MQCPNAIRQTLTRRIMENVQGQRWALVLALLLVGVVLLQAQKLELQ